MGSPRPSHPAGRRHFHRRPDRSGRNVGRPTRRPLDRPGVGDRDRVPEPLDRLGLGRRPRRGQPRHSLDVPRSSDDRAPACRHRAVADIHGDRHQRDTPPGCPRRTDHRASYRRRRRRLPARRVRLGLGVPARRAERSLIVQLPGRGRSANAPLPPPVLQRDELSRASVMATSRRSLPSPVAWPRSRA